MRPGDWPFARVWPLRQSRCPGCMMASYCRLPVLPHWPGPQNNLGAVAGWESRLDGTGWPIRDWDTAVQLVIASLGKAYIQFKRSPSCPLRSLAPLIRRDSTKVALGPDRSSPHSSQAYDRIRGATSSSDRFEPHTSATFSSISCNPVASDSRSVQGRQSPFPLPPNLPGYDVSKCSISPAQPFPIARSRTEFNHPGRQRFHPRRALRREIVIMTTSRTSRSLDHAPMGLALHALGAAG
jgi:hypothetical protein